MSKLETEINQIYLVPQDSSKTSQILLEVTLSSQYHLFLLSEIKNIQKRTEVNDLSKISEIILTAFKNNRKLPAQTIFETSLAEINNKLADFAHKGRKSWLGKFSALIALKTDKDILLTNSGQTTAWLKRKNDLMEVLSSEKPGLHPLKTFSSFSTGRIVENDEIVLSNSAIFNYISVELFSKLLSGNTAKEVTLKISEILSNSARPDEGFAVFTLHFAKKTEAKIGGVAENKALKPLENIYAPLPEDLEMEKTAVLPSPASQEYSPILKEPKFKIPSIPSIKLPKINIKLPEFFFLKSFAGPGRFFLISFIVFFILFGLNVVAYGVRSKVKKQNLEYQTQADHLIGLLSEAESSLIYKNEAQAFRLVGEAETELKQLSSMDKKRTEPFVKKFEDINQKVNKITTIQEPKLLADLQDPAKFISRAGSGLLISNANYNSIATYTDAVKSIFTLNRVDSDIVGLVHVSGQGHYVADSSSIYLLNEKMTLFEKKYTLPNAALSGLKFIDPNKLYTMNKNANQILKFTVSNNTISASVNQLKTNVNLSDAVDFGVGSDVYLLFPDRLTKYTNGTLAEFKVQSLSTPANQLTKVFIGSDIYLLETNKKRILIYNKKGELKNQIVFPTLDQMNNILVNEQQRIVYILNGNKIFQITF